jgi:hypothetical protein
MIDETAKRRNGETARKPIRHLRDLEVYQNALATGLRVYELSKKFPPEENADRPNPALFAIRLRQPCRGMAEAPV